MAGAEADLPLGAGAVLAGKKERPSAGEPVASTTEHSTLAGGRAG